MVASRCVIGLGANLGDRLATLEAASKQLADVGVIGGVSRLYETVAVGGPVQPDYFNAAVCLVGDWDPRRLLSDLLEIELSHGRVRDCRWGPRRLDLDILWLERAAIDEPGLVIPHPRLLERNFALVPLVEIAPDARDPNTGLEYRNHPNSKHTQGMRLFGVRRDVAASDGRGTAFAGWSPCG